MSIAGLQSCQPLVTANYSCVFLNSLRPTRPSSAWRLIPASKQTNKQKKTCLSWLLYLLVSLSHYSAVPSMFFLLLEVLCQCLPTLAFPYLSLSLCLSPRLHIHLKFPTKFSLKQCKSFSLSIAISPSLSSLSLFPPFSSTSMSLFIYL